MLNKNFVIAALGAGALAAGGAAIAASANAGASALPAALAAFDSSKIDAARTALPDHVEGEIAEAIADADAASTTVRTDLSTTSAFVSGNKTCLAVRLRDGSGAAGCGLTQGVLKTYDPAVVSDGVGGWIISGIAPVGTVSASAKGIRAAVKEGIYSLHVVGDGGDLTLTDAGQKTRVISLDDNLPSQIPASSVGHNPNQGR